MYISASYCTPKPSLLSLYHMRNKIQNKIYLEGFIINNLDRMILNAFLLLRYMYNIRHLNTCIYIYTNTLYYMKEINEKHP